MFKHIFDQSTKGKLIVRNNSIVACNTQAASDLGYASPDCLVSMLFSDLVDREIWDDASHLFPKTMSLRKEDGSFLEVHLALSYADAEQGRFSCVEWSPIGKLIKLERNAEYQEAILAAVINSSADLISYKDYINTDGMYFGCNHAFGELVGKSEEAIIGRTDDELFDPELSRLIREKDAWVLQHQEDAACEGWVVYPDGRKVLLHTLKTLLKDADGKAIGILSTSRDMTAEHRYKEELHESRERYKKLANTDELSGIPNRRLFFELAAEHFKLSKRSQEPLSSIMIDVDSFKSINDTRGHAVGDKVIYYVASTIRERLRESDLFARYAGDEFVILLPETDIKGAENIAKILLAIFKEHACCPEESEPIKPTISLGVASRAAEDTLETLLHRADEALYLAKHRGRNRVATL